MNETELGTMGKFIRGYVPPRFSINRSINDLLGPAARRAFGESAVIQTSKKLPDVSFYQGVIDWDRMRTQTDSVIIRAGQNIWPDTQFARNWAEAKRVGMKRGVYYFYDDRASPGSQADVLAGLIRNDLPEMETVADWENTYGGSFPGLGNVVAFMQRAEALLPSIRSAMYSGYYWFRDHSNPVTNASQYAYLKTRPLWEAWYTTNPAIVLIPSPWTSLLFWQWGTPSVGAQYGVGSSEIDMNYFNGTQADFESRYGGTLPPPPVQTEYQKIRRYNSDCHVLTIDPKVRRVHVTDTQGVLETVSHAAARLGAKWGTNGDMWGPAINGKYYPQSYAVSDGRVYHEQIEARPFLVVTRDGVPDITHQPGAGDFQVVSGVRYIVQNGVKPLYLHGSEPQYTERHPRTLYGVTADRKIIALIVDGRSATSSGVTLSEGAGILISDFGCVTALDLDGGGSSAIDEESVIQFYAREENLVLNQPSDGTERAVVNHVLFFDTGATTMQIIKGDVKTKVKIRMSPGGAEFVPARYLLAGDQIEAEYPNQAQWLKLTKINGTAVTDTEWSSAGPNMEYISWRVVDVPVEPPPPPPPPPASETVINMVLHADGTVSGTWTET